MSKALVSIIVPVYEVENYICRCLDSIRCQTYDNLEVILVDDGSKDRSGDICDEYAAMDRRIKVVHQQNGGVVKARNVAIAQAKGQYLAFVDADDYIAPQMIEVLVENCENNNSDIVWCDWVIEKKDLSRIKASANFDANPEKMMNRLFKDEIKGYLWNKLIRKDFWNVCNLKTDETCTMMEDWYLMVQMFCHNPKMTYVNRNLYYYIIRENSASTSEIPWLLRGRPNIEHTYDYLKEKDLLHNFQRTFFRYIMRVKFAFVNMGGAIYNSWTNVYSKCA